MANKFSLGASCTGSSDYSYTKLEKKFNEILEPLGTLTRSSPAYPPIYRDYNVISINFYSDLNLEYYASMLCIAADRPPENPAIKAKLNLVVRDTVTKQLVLQYSENKLQTL